MSNRRDMLPIRKYKDEIINTLSDNRVIVVIGHTGCGKSTQLPQMLFEEGYGDRGVIACTQPRRFAAYSLAKRVANEMRCKLGTTVGYRYRFTNRTNPRTRVLYMTDGSLMMQRIHNLRLTNYSVIMLDEVHERALQTDVLFGLLKQTIAERSDLKVIITSATLEADTFSRYFFNAPVIEVQGSMYPVDIVYRPVPERGNKFIAQEISNLDRMETEGDVLVFLAGKPEIEEISKFLATETSLHVLPAHAELSTAELDRIHEEAPDGKRKVVLATNVAETSLTVEGIVYVVDQGYVKLMFYNADSNTNELKRIRCSQAEAQQRKGRAGRTRPGKCYRLYSEYTFENEMPKLRQPEVTRANLTAMTLQLKSIGFDDVLLFDFLTRPDIKNFKAALDQLHQFEALDDECLLTRTGRLMVWFPVDPPLARSLVQSADEGCSEEMIMISAMTSAFNDANLRKLSPILTNNSKKVEDLISEDGEMFALLKIFQDYRDDNFSDEYLRHYELNWTVMNEAKQVYWQLIDVMKKHQLPICSCGSNKEPIVRSLVSGYFHYLTFNEGCGVHRVVRDKKTVKLQTFLLSEAARKSQVVIGVLFSKPSERIDRILPCVTSAPSEMDLTEYIDRFTVSCSHFGRNVKQDGEPFWLVDAKEWYDKYLETKHENFNLSEFLKREKERFREIDSDRDMLKRDNIRLQTTVDMQQRRIRELDSEVRSLRNEKAKAQGSCVVM